MPHKQPSLDGTVMELGRLAASAGYGPGARLPAERELAARLGVNRAILRKALARLEFEGRVTRHVGRGTFVAQPPAGPATPADGASPLALMDARLALEPVLAREAAVRARQQDLDDLSLCQARLERSDDYETFERWDIAFHQAVADATRNAIFERVNAMLRDLRSNAEWERMKRASFTPALRDRYRAEHRAILQALQARDQSAASAAMAGHMQSVRAALSGGRWG